jgi:hypothetical protein
MHVRCKSVFQMFQLFHLDVAYVVVAIHTYVASICSKCSYISDLCCKCFIWMLHIAMVIHVLQTYVSIVSPGFILCSRCYFPHSLTRGHIRTARTSVMRASSNSQTCTQQAVSAQMVEHSLIKVHAHMQSVRAGQHPTDVEPDALHHQTLVPMVEHAARVNMCMGVVLPPSLSLSLACKLDEPHTHAFRSGATATHVDPAAVGVRSEARR